MSAERSGWRTVAVMELKLSQSGVAAAAAAVSVSHRFESRVL